MLVIKNLRVLKRVFFKILYNKVFLTSFNFVNNYNIVLDMIIIIDVW